MACQIIRARRALTPTEEIEHAVVVIEDGKIAALGSREEIAVPPGAREYDAGDHTLIPGFVDIHIHGAGARDVMEATPEALATVSKTAARHGTTSLVATTVTASAEAICRSLEGIARYIQSPSNQEPSSSNSDSNSNDAQAQMLGIHLEGPFISSVRRGVHPAESLVCPSVATLNRFLSAADGCVRILTLAPELPGALEVIDVARAAGLTIAMGHTDATYAQACAGIEHGVRHAVHVFNAMRPFSHRETGVLGAALTDPAITAEVIADGVHVDDPALRLLLAAKGFGHIVLVSDGTAATGMPDGTYHLGPFEFTVSGGICRNTEGRLAGSTLTLDRAVRHMVSLGVPLREAVQMATLNPARRLGLANKGRLAPGADADLVLLSEDLAIAGVVSGGMGL